VDDPDAAAVGGEHQVAVLRVHYEIADGHRRREVASPVLRPTLAAIVGNPEPKFGAKKKEVGVDDVLLDHMSVPADRLAGLAGRGARARGLAHQLRPRLSVVEGAVEVRLHIAVHVAIERDVRRTRSEAAGLDPRYPRVLP